MMACQSYRGWKMWTRSQATYFLHRRLSVVAEAWEKEKRVEKPWLVPEEFALYSGRIGGATR